MYSKVLKDLDFERVIEALSKFLITESGRNYLKSLEPLSDSERDLQERVVIQFERLIDNGVSFPLYNLKDGKTVLEKIRIGSKLSSHEFRNLHDFLKEYVRLYEVVFNTDIKDTLPSPELIRHVIRTLSKNIGPEGEIRDDATDVLRELTQKRKRIEDRLKRTLNALLEEYFKKGLLREKFYTIKNHRYVFPFKTESHPDGIVQGYSNTDRTIYVEPYSIVDIENELVKVEDERKEEIERIVRELVELLSENYGIIAEIYEKVAWVDFLYAVAQFKSAKEAVFVKESDALYVKDFRHPVLVDIKGYENVVPFSIERFQKKGLFISGPNAGGKTVVLKSIGTIALSYIYGLPVIAEKAEIFPVNSVFTIGFTNEQNIVEGKSTFSGMIEEIKNVVNNVEEESIVLLDEPFSLTDPEEGEALAEGIVEYLLDRGARVFLTTHLWGLKFFGEEHPEIENATMLFDMETEKPLYRFRLGRMGKSHAIQIAEKIGLPESIIEYAKSRLTEGQGKVLDLIARLEEEEGTLVRRLREVESLQQELMERERRLKRQGKKLILMEYDKVQKELKEMLRELYREAKRDKKIKKVQEARKHIEEKKKEVDKFEKPAKKPEVGKNYRIKPTGIIATLVEIKKKKAIVQIGKAHMEVPLESLYEV